MVDYSITITIVKNDRQLGLEDAEGEEMDLLSKNSLLLCLEDLHCHDI